MEYPHGSRLRSGRYSSTGQIYLITTVTYQRRCVFADFHAARHAIRSLRFIDRSGETHTLAYVLMPDHLHWLFQLRRGDLASIMRRFKSFSANEIRGHLGPSLVGKIWQPGYYDRALREEDDLRAAARYIIANPLRKGMVDRVGDYPHWDAVWVGGGEDGSNNLLL